MKLLFTFFLIFAFFGVTKPIEHPYFLSVVELNQPEALKELEISVKIFTDDFEQTLRKNYPTDIIDLYNSKNPERMKILINQYIQSKLSITVNGVQLSKKYIGHEKQNNATMIYFETNYFEKITSVEVDNSLLYDYKTEQNNIVHLRMPGLRKSFKLINPESKVSAKL